MPLDLDIRKVTRFEVIDHSEYRGLRDMPQGRLYVRYNVNVELSFQDDGRTLKVFVTERKNEHENPTDGA